jgi:hypothetical protein
MNIANNLQEQCIIPDSILKFVAASTAGVYVFLLTAWIMGILLPEQVVVLFIIYTIFAGLLTVRHISILKKPAKVLLLGVAYAGVTSILHSQFF